MSKKQRQVLSPHLTIYKPQISSMLSISHRASGVFNFLGMLIFIWYIISIPYTQIPLKDNILYGFFVDGWGMYLLMLWTFSLFFHACTGVRHLFWDMGMGFGLKATNITGYLAVIMAILLTSFCWMVVYQPVWMIIFFTQIVGAQWYVN